MYYHENFPLSMFARANDLTLTGSRLFIQPNAEKLKPSVLIVSRDADAVCMYRTILELWSYRVEIFSQAAELAEMPETEQPAVILLDGVLRFEKTLAEIRLIREDGRFSKLPLIVLSGFSQTRFRNRAFISGADDFLVKPLDLDLLERRIEKNLEKFVIRTVSSDPLALLV